MTARERVTAAMSRQMDVLDRVPVYPILSGVGRKLIDASYPDWSTNADICTEAFIKTTEEFDLDCIVTLIDLSVECDAWGQKIIYPENEAAHPDYSDSVIKSIEDYALIQKVDYRNSQRMMMQIDVCKNLVKEKGEEYPIIAFVFGPLGTLSMLRNQQDMYMDLYDDPDAVKGAVGNIAATLQEYALALCDTGVDAIMWDTLFSSGSIMSKDMWKEMEGDFMRDVAKAVEARGVMNMVHNCGENVYFDAQIECIDPVAISFLFPPDDCNSFAETKEKYGDNVMLIGAVTPASAVIGTDEEREQQCYDQIDAMAEGGGFMLATGCEYPANASFERAQRMIDIAKEYGRYDK